jgi:hypothetical protein
MYCTFVFASYKGLVCILNEFVHMSHGLCFSNNVGFCNVHCNARR